MALGRGPHTIHGIGTAIASNGGVRSTCVKCGAREHHERIASLAGPWHRCRHCNHSWRGLLPRLVATFARQGDPTALGDRRAAPTETPEDRGTPNSRPTAVDAGLAGRAEESPDVASATVDQRLAKVDAAYEAATGNAYPSSPPAMVPVSETPGSASNVGGHWLAQVEAAYDAATGKDPTASRPALMGLAETTGFAPDADGHWLAGVEAAYDAAAGMKHPVSRPAIAGVTMTADLASDADSHWLDGVETAYDVATGEEQSPQLRIVPQKRADLEDWVQGKEEASTVPRHPSPSSSTETVARAISRLTQLNADLDRVTAAFARSGGSLRGAEAPAG